MSVNVRIKNGMAPDTGTGGATEGDIRGDYSDLIDIGGVVDLAGGDLLVHEAGSPAMTVVVDAGTGYIPNTSYDDTDSDSVKFWEAVVAGTTGSRTLSIDANSSGQTRYDLVCLKIDAGLSPDKNASNVAELIIVKGTGGAGIPATPSYHLKLAEVQVVNGATEITNAKITDSRVQSKIKEAYLPATTVLDYSDQTISGIKTFNSGKLKATRPQVTTSIDDSNGNELFKVTATGSAVNEITVANSATGNNPKISATGGDNDIAIEFEGKGTRGSKFNNVVTGKVVTLSDGATPALDASLGNTFYLDAAGNRTIAVPSNPVDGQRIVILHYANGGARTLALNSGAGGFAFGTDIASLSATTSGKTDVISCLYVNAIGKWLVVGYLKGF